jgi:hypothetical protein
MRRADETLPPAWQLVQWNGQLDHQRQPSRPPFTAGTLSSSAGLDLKRCGQLGDDLRPIPSPLLPTLAVVASGRWAVKHSIWQAASSRVRKAEVVGCGGDPGKLGALLESTVLAFFFWLGIELSVLKLIIPWSRAAGTALPWGQHESPKLGTGTDPTVFRV